MTLNEAGLELDKDVPPRVSRVVWCWEEKRNESECDYLNIEYSNFW